MLGYFSSDLSIDLGTANTLVYVKGKGVVIREPSIITRHKKTKKVLAIGSEAKKMMGRTPVSIEVIRPMKDGVISDFDITLAMLSYFVRKVHAKPGRTFVLPRPKVVIGVPSNISEVERRAVLDAAYGAGARSAYLIEEGLAAAIGAGLPVQESVGSMVVDIGGGTTEIAVVSLGGVVVGRSIKIGGDTMDTDIINYIRTRYSLGIGERTAEEIKIALGGAYVQEVEKQMVVRGRDLENGLPKTIRFSSPAAREALFGSVNLIVENVKDVVEDTPPELAADIAERGIMLCGGGAKLSGLAKLISKETKMSVSIAEDPLLSVVLGAAQVLENPALFSKVKKVSA
ncbi:MAG: rod shape-determining protein [Candidatus Curtissbacteria bacterium]|nr:rod shape-determining protein [Candidatus Curtissbacteria bacterium]